MPKEKSKVEKTKAKKTIVRRPKVEALTVPVYTLENKKSGKLELPKELFGMKVNKPLLAQVVRVYLNNLKAHYSSTKTRSEVAGSTRKIQVQKGTGHARHGSIRAPIFVGGGMALGPKFRKVTLDLPKKMKRAALQSALSSKFAEGEVFGIKDLEGASGKTKQMATLLKNLGKKDTLLVFEGKNDKLARATRNLRSIKILPTEQLNAFEAMAHQTLLLTKEAVEKLTLKVKRSELRKEEEKRK